MIQVRKTGDLRKALRQLERFGETAQRAVHRAVLQEGHLLRKVIVQGITNQAPGNEPLAPVSALTAAHRRLRRFGGTKALIVRADLRNSVNVVSRPGSAHVRILRTARASDGHALVDVAAVQEFGMDAPVIIPITPKMRRFLHKLLREAGIPRPKARGNGNSVVVLQVPARPFLRPAYALFKPGAARRFRQRVSQELTKGGP